MRYLLLLSLAACSSTVDLGGVYMVTSDVSSMPCGTDTPVQMAPVYVKFSEDSLLGTKIWSYVGCTDAAGTMCDSFGDSFPEPIDNGWQGVESSDSFSGSSCTLGYYRHTAVLTGKMLVIDANDYSDSPALDQAHCTTAEAEKRNTTMPCFSHERIEAARL